MYELRNIKCVIELDEISPKLLSKFEQRKQNNILRLKQTIVLTIYPSSYNRIHVTGIKNTKDFQLIKLFFARSGTKIKEVQVNNTYWIKRYLIERFLDFAQFCKKNKHLFDFNIDLNSFAMNIDGYLNAIYLRHKNATGTAVIHRKCVALLGSKTLSCIQLLANRVDLILQAYKNACSQKPELK